MSDRPIVRRLEPDQWPAYRAIRLQALQDAPDAFGATLDEALALTAEDWANRLAQAAVSGVDCPLAAEFDDRLVGLIWARVDAQQADNINLYQMWVAPQWRGHGVAGMLLGAVIAWSRSRGARSLELGVNCANPTAIGFYARTGFVTVGSPYPMRAGTVLMEQRMRLELHASQ